MAFGHQGAFDESAVLDVVNSQCSGSSLALTPTSVFPAGFLTGSQDVVAINTGANPLTQTTRSALQMIQDLQQQLGFVPPQGYQWFLTLVHQGAGTLTLAGGAGVTLGTGTNSVATTGNRTYLCTVTTSGLINPAITIQTTGSGAA